MKNKFLKFIQICFVAGLALIVFAVVMIVRRVRESKARRPEDEEEPNRYRKD